VEKFPNNRSLVAACQRGKARQLAGEAFRQMSLDPGSAQSLFRQSMQYAPGDIRYKVGYFFSKFALTRLLAGRAKYVLKRHFG
jgi:hypothetical protein